jgi:hypothetical protein
VNNYGNLQETPQGRVKKHLDLGYPGKLIIQPTSREIKTQIAARVIEIPCHHNCVFLEYLLRLEPMGNLLKISLTEAATNRGNGHLRWGTSGY